MRCSPLIVLALAACGNDLAVREVLTPPEVVFTSPGDGDAFAEATVVEAIAVVGDATDHPQDLRVEWRSDLDGQLEAGPTAVDGTSVFASASLSPGLHTLAVTVTDSDGQSATAAVAVDILDLPDAPEVTVVRPVTGDSVLEGQSFELVATVADDLDAVETLDFAVESDLDGAVCAPFVDALGEARCEVELSVGRHLLTFTAVDSEGHAGEATAFLQVIAGIDVDDDGDGWTEAQGDCDDTNSAVLPGAPEYCDGVDSDCDGLIDDGTNCYDDDGDGQTEEEGDCDDADPAIYEGADDPWYDGVDSDCLRNDDYDADGDGYALDDDCDDTRFTVNPDGGESCNELDDDCDGATDEGVTTTYYRDADADGYGSSDTVEACARPTGYVDNTLDCYDGNDRAYPGSDHWGSGDRGDGSYDYDCDGSESRYYTSTQRWECTADNSIWGSSVSWQSGWYGGSRPACGSSRTYAAGCDYDEDWFTGYFTVNGPDSTSSRTQYCQ